ncbi:MAG TPA: glycosyl hydrolase family 28-related protein [Tepidisphaeraceae bacterium]|jgi:hypothetical protein|nr:glycosyl hydrolase family 28-related protein [Tepidisphaeraceae bacterium]
MVDALEPRVLLAGDGLSVVYYDGANVTQAREVQGVPHPAIVVNLGGTSIADGAWGGGRPAAMATGDSDTWSARFTGEVETLHGTGSSTYTFRTYSDDGVRVWVDGQLVINAWNDHGPRYDSGSIALAAGRKYQLRVEYYDNTASGTLRLEWNRPGMAAGTYEVVPQANFYSGRRVFPANLNQVNVKDFGAVGDGIADDWAAIQQAISSVAGNANTVASKVVYLPDGTYKVSKQLEWRTYKVDSATNQLVPDTTSWGGWRGYIVLQGESRGNTVVKLANNTFTSTPDEDPATWSPNAVLYTASSDSIHKYSDVNGAGNMAFLNGARDLSIHMGSGNTGAVGISYQTSNEGQLRDVNILSDGAAGFAGLRMARDDNGPGLVKDVLITGFQYGIQGPAYSMYSNMNFEHVTLRGQMTTAINSPGCGPTWSFRDLRSINSVPGLTFTRNATNNIRQGNVVLVDSSFTGGAAGTTAISSPDASALFIRNTTFGGYGTSISSTVAGVTTTRTGNVGEFVSHAVAKNFPDAPGTSLNLPVNETPEYENLNVASDWAYVGAPSGGDDTAAIQSALNSGKPVVYFKGWAWYRISTTLTVPATVRKIVFDHATIAAATTGSIFTNATSPAPFLKFMGATAEPVIVDRAQLRLHIDTLTTAGAQGFLHDTARPLVFTGLLVFTQAATQAYLPTANAGDVYFEDAAISGMTFRRGQNVWARSLNPEGSQAVKITNDGANLWILGLKIEHPTTVLQTQNFGRSEVLGGLQFPNFKGVVGQGPTASSPPAFVNNQGYVSISYGSLAYPPSGTNSGTFDWYTHFRESRDGSTYANLIASSLPGRGGGKNVALYRGGATLVRTETSARPTASGGATHGEFADAQASLGYTSNYAATGVGDYVTYAVNGVPPGDFTLKVTFKRRPNAPIVQVAVATSLNGPYTNVGAPLDLYSASPSFQRLTAGSISTSANRTVYVRLMVSDLGAASGGCLVQTDKVELEPVL